MSRGVDHVFAKSVVLANIGSPRNARDVPGLFDWSLGKRLRSHTTYAVPAVCGSAVSDSLSLNTKWFGESSRWTVTCSLHVAPPFVEVLVRIAEIVCSALTDRLTW